MNVLTFDVETTHKEKTGGGHTPLPYFGNHLVSVGYKWLVSGVDYDCYYHSTEPPTQAAAEGFQSSTRSRRRHCRSQRQVRLGMDKGVWFCLRW